QSPQHSSEGRVLTRGLGLARLGVGHRVESRRRQAQDQNDAGLLRREDVRHRGRTTSRMKLTRRALCVACLVLIAATLAPASARGTSYRAGTPFIEDRGGRVVVLHGFNMVWKTPPY